MNLKERFLEHVLSGGAVAEEAHEEVIQLALITRDERAECRLVAVAVVGEQLFVGAVGGGEGGHVDGSRAAVAVPVAFSAPRGCGRPGHRDEPAAAGCRRVLAVAAAAAAMVVWRSVHRLHVSHTA